LRRSKWALVLVFTGLFVLPVQFAAAAGEWYGGLAGGGTRGEASELEHDYPQDGPPVQVSSSDFRESHGAWKAFAGWRPIHWVAIELSYADYGTQKLGYTATPITFAHLIPQQTGDGRRSVKGWNGDILGFLPIATNMEGFVGIGIAHARVKLTTNFISYFVGLEPQPSPTTSSSSDTSTAARFSLGIAWIPSAQWSVRLGYEHLAKVGISFETGSVRGDHTGRSSQETLWLSMLRTF
jgi:opacity protein-like surface antigen